MTSFWWVGSEKKLLVCFTYCTVSCFFCPMLSTRGKLPTFHWLASICFCNKFHRCYLVRCEWNELHAKVNSKSFLYFRPLVWGNQEPIRPISRATLSANTQSERLITLATPKKDFQPDHPIKCNRCLHLNEFHSI